MSVLNAFTFHTLISYINFILVIFLSAANDSEKYVLDGKGSCKYLTSTMLSVLSGDTIIMGYRAEDMRGFLLQLKYSK